MSSYKFLLDIALILLSTKVFGLVTKRFHLPQVVGALIAGLIFGPAVLNILHGTDFLTQLSELGVIVIMFTAGLETNIGELKKNGKAGFLVALFGVLVPLIGGTAFGFVFNRGEVSSSGSALIENIFLGVVLTATSVSITVETLKETGRLNTKVGNTILAAALIDDVLGLVCLTIVSSLGGDASAGIGTVLLKIALFFVFAGVVGFLIRKGLVWYSHRMNDLHLQRFPILALAICLLMAYAAEHFFGVADIIGAYVAGLTFGSTKQATYINSRFRPMSYMLLTPIFFASVGINTELDSMSSAMIVATIVFVVLAVLTKLIGCGIGARISGMSPKESVQTGLGMICRGEVALIVANKGRALGLISGAFFSPIIIMVVFTTIATPILLKLAFRKDDKYSDLHASDLIDNYEAIDNLTSVGYSLLEMESHFKNSRNPWQDDDDSQ